MDVDVVPTAELFHDAGELIVGEQEFGVLPGGDLLYVYVGIEPDRPAGDGGLLPWIQRLAVVAAEYFNGAGHQRGVDRGFVGIGHNVEGGAEHFDVDWPAGGCQCRYFDVEGFGGVPGYFEIGLAGDFHYAFLAVEDGGEFDRACRVEPDLCAIGEHDAGASAACRGQAVVQG